MESSVVVKVFRLLEKLGASVAGCPLGEAAVAVGMPKPTAHRLLKMMTNQGYVSQSEEGLYLLTNRIDQLRRSTGDRRLFAAAEPALAALHRRTGENVNLGVLRADKIVYLSVLESTHPLRRIAEPNSTDPVHCTALGRSIAAFLDRAQRDALLRRTEPFLQRTPHTVIRPEAIMKILDGVRTAGFAIERDQTDIGVTCYGAPIFGGETVIAAVSLSLPSARCEVVGEKELIRSVSETAAKISRKMSQSNGVDR